MKTITHIEDAITAIKDGCTNIALNVLEEARLNEKARDQLIDGGVMPNHQLSEKSEALDDDEIRSYAHERFGDPAQESGFFDGVKYAEAAHGIKE